MSAQTERSRLAALGAFALIFGVVFTLFFYLGYADDLLKKDGRTVVAEFAAVPQLKEGDPVRVDGREEGKVRKIEDLDGGRGARVTFDVAQDAGPLYRDSEVDLRWRNLLGSAFYLEVDRGTPQQGKLGDAVIPRAKTTIQVELEDFTSVFRGGVRKGLRTMFDQGSVAFGDPDTLPDLLRAAETASPDIERALRGFRGQRPDVDLRRVITGTAATVTALDAPNDDLNKLVEGTASFVGTLGDREADLRAALDQGPGVTSDVRATFARLDTTLEKADVLVGKLDGPAPDVAPTLSALRPTLASTATLLGRTRPLLKGLPPTLSALSDLGKGGRPLLDALQPSLDRFDDVILPYLSREAPDTGKPTSTMIGGTAAGFGGSAGQQDENGHFIRFPASGGSSSVYLPCRTALTDPTAGETLACDRLEKAADTYLNYVPNLTDRPMNESGK